MAKISRLLLSIEEKKHKKGLHRYQDDSYDKYVEKHGLHFCKSLAEHVINCMENQNGTPHKWSIDQVKTAVLSVTSSCNFKHKVTDADMAYLANMYYSDFYPDVMDAETDCIKAAIKIANDPDGYEGQAFCRWVADVMASHKHIEWEKYI